MTEIVQFKITEDGDKWPDKYWHAIYTFAGDCVAICNGQHFGYGQGAIEESGKHYNKKSGKTNCPDCIEIIKDISKMDYVGKTK